MQRPVVLDRDLQADGARATLAKVATCPAQRVTSDASAAPLWIDREPVDAAAILVEERPQCADNPSGALEHERAHALLGKPLGGVRRCEAEARAHERHDRRDVTPLG